MLNKSRKFILDTVFPIFCASCDKEGVLLCKECENTILLTNSQFCPKCNRKTLNGEVCDKCRDNSFLDSLVSFGFYHNPTLRKLITSLKYNNTKEVVVYLEKFSLRFLNKHSLEYKDFLVMSVPLHKKKLWLRGFNQADFLASIVLKHFNLQFKGNILKRRVDTYSQAQINNNDRLENIIGAFICKNRKKIENKEILLVDDVYTTGATMQECAKVLKENGAKSVRGIVWARG